MAGIVRLAGVDLTLGTGTIVGEITTNGSLGELSTADFTKWSLTLTDTAIAGLPQTLTQANSALTFLNQSGAALSATPDMQASRSTITCNFGSHDGDLFAFQLNGEQSGDAGFCGANADSITCDSEPDPALTIGNPNATTKADFVTETGIVKLGTVAAPEMDSASTASADAATCGSRGGAWSQASGLCPFEGYCRYRRFLIRLIVGVDAP